MGQSKAVHHSGAGSRAHGAGRRIYEQLRAQMADGRLGVGALLPSTRVLAAELGVSRTTVSAVYDQLAAEGFIHTAAGKAARVAVGAAGAAVATAASKTNKPVQPEPGTARAAAPLSAFGRLMQSSPAYTPPGAQARGQTVDFLYGAVGARDFPSMAWRRAYLAALLASRPRHDYAAPEGEAGLRQALAGYLARARGLHCTPEQLVVVNGSQQAIDLCARVLLDADSAFVFEDPGYRMAQRCFAATGAQALPVPVDEHGLDTRRLPQDRRIRLAYVTPSHQFPLGGTLPMARRQELLAWARRQRAWIVEDDYDGEFRYGLRPIDALASLDADGRVIYVGTFSKALSPQLRLGYLVLPPALLPAFGNAKRLVDRHAPVLEQQAMAALIDSGAYERHVRRVRRAHERRRAALLRGVAQHLPPGCEVLGAAAGLHVVLRLPAWRASDEAALVEQALCHGVKVYPSTPLWFRPPAANARREAQLVLGYASLSVEQIDQGMARLGRAVRGMPRQGRAAARKGAGADLP